MKSRPVNILEEYVNEMKADLADTIARGMRAAMLEAAWQTHWIARRIEALAKDFEDEAKR